MNIRENGIPTPSEEDCMTATATPDARGTDSAAARSDKWRRNEENSPVEPDHDLHTAGITVELHIDLRHDNHNDKWPRAPAAPQRVHSLPTHSTLAYSDVPHIGAYDAQHNTTQRSIEVHIPAANDSAKPPIMPRPPLNVRLPLQVHSESLSKPAMHAKAASGAWRSRSDVHDTGKERCTEASTR
ncbi:hypothetical protein BWQ96_06645 [Gracilariopsis chorda]|uniref:Uncharacterized protein n=1 Tax=Gracilariopsis chorda TaxID=448386 RepID=A0A2V3INI0_9FLOR|nr:hypothetical protein BWQ96_06645 [Gracilariopsis chorda]|eukprot:PXF43636.1 hypothetical protein BWQ96_06645 [Gracilariopsis chorda]